MPQRRVPISHGQLDEALELLHTDELLAPLVARLSPPQPGGRKEPFDALIVALLNQLISRKVAGVIEGRLRDLVGKPFTPASISELDPEKFRTCGLSRNKVACAKACAADSLAHDFTAKSCRHLTDEQIVQRIIAIKGAGPWTAHMVLLFGLGRPDVLPDGDGGIQRAAALLFGSRSLATARRRLVREARRWRPFRSIAAWYLWRSLG